MSLENPYVTIFTTVYNGDKYLKKAIESNLNQTYRDFEYIIINNGSTDKSLEIIKSYDDPRIRIISLDNNIGLSNVRNLGYKEAKGRYVALLDADDISLPSRIEKQVKILDLYPDVALCSTNLVTINEKSEIISGQWYKKDNIPLEWQMLWSDIIANSSTMVRKEILEKNNIKNNPELFPVEDYDLWCKTILHSRIYRIDEVLIQYRVHGNNTFFSMMEKADDLAIKVINDFVFDLTNEKTPDYHFYFSPYAARLNIEIKKIAIDKICLLFEKLKEASVKNWKLNKLEEKYIYKDINYKIINYIDRFSFQDKIKYSKQLIKIKKILGLKIFFKTIFKQLILTVKNIIKTIIRRK